MNKSGFNTDMLEGDLFAFKVQTEENFSVKLKDGNIVCYYKDTELNFSEDKDDFCKAMFSYDKVEKFLKDFPLSTLYGCWTKEKFIVTDIEMSTEDGLPTFQNFEAYHHFLAHYGINYRMPIAKFCNHKNLFYINRLLDNGLWVFKNYGKQIIQGFEINDDERISTTD